MRKKISPEGSTSITLSSDSRSSLFYTNGCLNLLNSVRIVVLVGLFSTLASMAVATLYFRPAILAVAIPVTVISATVHGILRQKHHFLWPIIGTSWFHAFITLYFNLIFMYFFIFKPNYIIMVLNWAFDTLYTTKTTSYYVQCTVIIIATCVFGLFNVWQLHVMMNFKKFLRTRRRVEKQRPATVDTYHRH